MLKKSPSTVGAGTVGSNMVLGTGSMDKGRQSLMPKKFLIEFGRLQAEGDLGSADSSNGQINIRTEL